LKKFRADAHRVSSQPGERVERNRPANPSYARMVA
jgi:hypothetical protein